MALVTCIFLTSSFRILVIFSSLLYSCSPCGVTTHIEIGHRALVNFKSDVSFEHVNIEKLLYKHGDSFQAGNAYPDAYYPNVCFSGKYHGVSEDSHWTPFINATINYIRRHFPPPWDQATEKLVVFLYGFASHQVADVSWHSLGIDQGFLTTMGKINFHGSFDKAHPIGDFGGDILNQYELPLPYIGEIQQWYVPVEDLLKIYEELYGREVIQTDVIIGCTFLLYMERLGEDIAVAELFRDYAAKSPFLVDNLEDYYLGGLDDMAAQTQNVWQYVGLMLTQGTSSCNIPHNPLYITCNGNKTNVGTTGRYTNGYYGNHKSFVNNNSIAMKRTQRGITLMPSKAFQKLQQQKYSSFKTENGGRVEGTSNIDVGGRVVGTSNIEVSFSSYSNYSKFGWSLASGDINGDGHSDLLIGSPGWGMMGSFQQGRIYISLGSEKSPHFEDNFITIAGEIKAQSKFGTSVESVDINQDGISDIIVGAPSYTTDGTHYDYMGMVYIYFGNIKKQFDSPNITISCQFRYCNLGWTLTTGDLNEDGHPDLLIGTPFAPGKGAQRGLVAGLYSNVKFSAQGSLHLDVTQLDWIQLGDQDYGWFGNSITFHNSWLVIGQPVFRLCFKSNCSYSLKDKQSVGKVHIFKTTSKGPHLIKTLIGYDQFGQFGSSFAIGRPFDTRTDILAVSAITTNVSGTYYGLKDDFLQAGQVFLYNLTQIEVNTSVSPITTFSGNRRFSRFGQSLKFADTRDSGFDDLVITSPLYSEDISDLIPSEAEQGQVYIFYGGEHFPRGKATQSCNGHINPCPQEKADTILTFNDGEKRARFGSSLITFDQANQTLLVMGAVHSSYQGFHMQGAVGVYSNKLSH